MTSNSQPCSRQISCQFTVNPVLFGQATYKSLMPSLKALLLSELYFCYTHLAHSNVPKRSKTFQSCFICKRDKGAWDFFSLNPIEDTAHRSDADYRISWRFMTDPSSLSSLASSPTCVPRLGSSPPTSPMTVLDDEINDNLEEADTRYTENDIFIIQTNYDPEQNIKFDPGRKNSKEDDFAYTQRIFAYTERERERAEEAIIPKNLHDLAEKVCHFL
jgi:hypothetical protein